MNMALKETPPMQDMPLTFEGFVNKSGIRVRFHHVDEAYPLLLDHVQKNTTVNTLLNTGVDSLVVMLMIQDQAMHLGFFNTESRLNYNYLTNRVRFLASEGIYLIHITKDVDTSDVTYQVVKHGEVVPMEAILSELAAEPFHYEKGPYDEAFSSLSVLVLSK